MSAELAAAAAGLISSSAAGVESGSRLRIAMAALSLETVARHFDPDKDYVEPVVICEGVSVGEFNEYFRDDERPKIQLRFVELTATGCVIIIDWAGPVHEITIREFESEFLEASGNRRVIATRGSFTAHRAGNPNKEADATFGPKRNTINRSPVPAGRTVDDWVTFAVEVGRWQTWAQLVFAAQWWSNYNGIVYILLLKVSARGRSIGYRLYHVIALGHLPAAPIAQGTFRRNNAAPAVNVSLSARSILTIPAHQALPAGVQASIVINLRDVMQQVIDSLH